VQNIRYKVCLKPYSSRSDLLESGFIICATVVERWLVTDCRVCCCYDLFVGILSLKLLHIKLSYEFILD
jgi:hypothetical protein